MALTWLGQQPVEAPFIFLGRAATRMFFTILARLCFAAWLERNTHTLSDKENSQKEESKVSIQRSLSRKRALQKEEVIQIQYKKMNFLTRFFSFFFLEFVPNFIEFFLQSKKEKAEGKKRAVRLFLFYYVFDTFARKKKKQKRNCKKGKGKKTECSAVGSASVLGVEGHWFKSGLSDCFFLDGAFHTKKKIME